MILSFLYAARVDSLQRTSSVIFYTLGLLTIAAIVLVQRGVAAATLSLFLNIVDLPLLLTGMLFGGGALVSSLSREWTSPALVAIVFVPLSIVFLMFAYLNFALPFPVEVS